MLTQKWVRHASCVPTPQISSSRYINALMCQSSHVNQFSDREKLFTRELQRIRGRVLKEDTCTVRTLMDMPTPLGQRASNIIKLRVHKSASTCDQVVRALIDLGQSEAAIKCVLESKDEAAIRCISLNTFRSYCERTLNYERAPIIL